ncbi:MAG TPA: histidine phosphatase family protein, partial [Trebonia sp.]
MRLYLARHAQTLSNVEHALDTAYPGAVLTDLGQEQAARLAARLAGEPLAVVAASPLLRAQQTATALAAERGRTVLTFDGLREVDAGDLEMRTSGEAIASYVAVLRAWAAGDLDVAIPGGTSGHEFLDRFDDAVRAIENATLAADPGGSSEAAAVAVSHGAAIRTWAALRCRNADGAELSRRGLPNTGVAIVAGSSRTGWLLDGWIEEGTDAIPADAAFNVVAEAE